MKNKPTFSTSIILLLSTLTPLSAATVLFDIGPTGGLAGVNLTQTTHSGDVWNNFGQIAGNTDHGGVQDSAGNATAFTLSAAGVGNRDGNTTLNAGYTGSTPQPVMNSWYFRSGAGAMTFVFKGAAANSVWDIEVLNSFNTPGTSDMQVNGLFANGSAAATTPANGDNWDRQTDGFNAGTGLIFNNAVADASGNFTITITSDNGTLQGLSFTEVVPEPSSTALLGLGGLTLILRRRK